jgi:lipopolysaccharide export system protein LptA
MRAARASARWLGLGALLALPLAAAPAAAQGIDLSRGGPIAITARDGITWLRAQHEVIARGDAHAVRQNVTVVADRLTAWYRRKPGTKPTTPAPSAAAPAAAAPPGAAPAGATPAGGGVPNEEESGDNEIYRLEAAGHVQIFTPTDHATCDRAVYDLDKAVLVMTGNDLRLVTPNEVLTAKQDLEYWSARHMAVARGDAVVVTRSGRRISGDVLVAYSEPSPAQAAGATPTAPAGQPATDPLGSSGKLKRVEAFGHVVLRTATDIVTGDRGVYVPATGQARLVGNVRITRGKNQLAGEAADVDLKTGVATLLPNAGARVQGLIVPSHEAGQALSAPPAGERPAAPAAPPGGAQPKAKPKGGQPKGGQP